MNVFHNWEGICFYYLILEFWTLVFVFLLGVSFSKAITSLKLPSKKKEFLREQNELASMDWELELNQSLRIFGAVANALFGKEFGPLTRAGLLEMNHASVQREVFRLIKLN